MMRNKCRMCVHYKYDPTVAYSDTGFYSCEYCNFEYDETLPYDNDDWDIFELDDDFEWSHLQILDRLDRKGVPCIAVDIWIDNNLAILTGCNAHQHKIASALNIHEDCIYIVGDTTMVVINLYMEKCIRHDEDAQYDLD